MRFHLSARTPLFHLLRRAIVLARQGGAISAEELVAKQGEVSRSRREALKAGVAAVSGLAFAREARAQRSAPRIVIVGAGIAGLCAAHALRKAGLRATIYEAGTRAGGRIFTARGLLGQGLFTELGGEFIDSEHKEMFRLAREFDIELIDLDALSHRAQLHDTFYFDRAHRTERQAIAEFQGLADRMEADCEQLDELVDFEHEGGGRALDRLSVTEYLDRIGARGWIRKLIEVAYADEFGLDCDRLSALNLLFLISTDLSEKFALYGASDERFRLKGGNQQLIEALSRRLTGQIVLEHRLERVRSAGDGYRLSFARPGGASVEVDADFLIVTLPFSVLRQVELRLELPEFKRRVIAELGYGTNTKLVAGVERRVWRERGFTGAIFSDEPFQSAWDNARGQPGTAAGLTLFSGGRAGIEAGRGTPAEQVQRLIAGVEHAFPGVTAALNGKVGRYHWPTDPLAQGSYACYLPGQWTTLAGAEGRPVGRLFFAGEHCSFNASGYMNSGAVSGRLAARGVLKICDRG